MKKKSLLITILLLISIVAFSLTACNNLASTLETLKNEYGTVVDGGGFEEGSTLVSNEIVTTTEEAAEVLTAIADQNYNKDGSVFIFDIYVTKDGVKVQPNGKVTVSVPIPNVEIDNYLVFHVKEDSSVEKLIPTVANGKISFETSSFSYFIIAEDVPDTPECTEHTYGTDGKCTVCGTACVHTEVIDAAVAPTCTEAGKTEGKHCSVCNTVIVAQEEIAATGHTEVIDAAVAPTCTEAGKTEGKHCSVCNTVIAKQEEIAATGHTEVIDVAVAPTCTEAGKTEGKHCSVCNTVIVAQEEIAATGHTEVIDAAVAPTCTEAGKTEGKHCSVCNTVIAKQEEIAATGHTEVIDAAVAPTCTEAGKTEGKHCSVCNTILAKQEEIPATGHTEVIDAAVAPTCTEAGKTEGKHCSVCNIVIVAQEEIAATGHTEVIDAAVAPTCTEAGKTEGKHCSVCNTILVAQEEVPVLDHAYVWVEGKASTCKEEGIAPHYHCDGCGKNFDENKGEIASVLLPIGSHEYGSMYWGKSANFFHDGNIEYYQCSVCEKYFDNEYNEVESVVIPKYSTNLSICVNGTPAALTLYEQNESQIIWSLEGLSVTKGDVITICQTDNAEFRHNYFAEGNVDKDGKILTTAAAANVVLEATPNGLMLFIDGYKYEGIVIEINGEEYPMNFVTYPSGEETSYVYGYVNFAVGDKFVIIDNVSGTVYDYDDLDPAFAWDTWDFHRGDNGEFVIDYSARYGIEFDNNGNKKIYISKAFAPCDGESFGVVFEGDREDVLFDSMELPTGDDAYNEFMWTLTHCTTMNNADFIEYINKNGLIFCYTIIDIEAGEKFRLKNFTTDEFIGADYLVDIAGDITAVTREGDLVSVQKSGSFYIIYLPAFNSFTIECDTSSSSSEIYMYLDGELISLTKEGEVVTYTNLEATTSTNILFVNGTFTVYYPITIDSQTDSAIAHVVESDGMSTLFFDKAGTYNLAYNVETGVLSITSVGGDENEDTEFDPSNYLYYLSVSGGSGATQTLAMQVNSSNSKEVYYKGVELTASCFIGVIEMAKDASSNTTYGALASDVDSSIAQSYGTVAMVKIAGTYDVYFDTEAKTIKLVAVSSGSCAEGACVYDDGVVTKEPTHLEEGVKTFTCTICGKTKEEPIAKTSEHSFGNYMPDEVDETKHYRECACGEKETADCTFDEGIVTKEPTHTGEGIKTFTCTVCGRTRTESIEKTSGHSFGNYMPDEVDETKHYRQCGCGEIETADCTFENGICTVCGREKTEESGFIIVISGGTATFVGKETVTSESNLYGENAIVYLAQENDVLNVTLTDQDGRVFKHWASATGMIIPDEDFSMLVLISGYYYPVFEDADEFLNNKKIYEGNCEEGVLYMSTNSKGDIKYELEFVNDGRHDLAVCTNYNSQYHVQECVLCGELVFEAHTEQTSEVAQQPTHTEEGVMRHECSCGYSWTESIPVTDEHSVNYDDWHIVEESKNGQYGKYRVYCRFCDYYEEYWYLGGLDFVSFIDGKMIHYQYTYGGMVCHDEYYYNYRNAEGKKVYVWAFQYAYEYSTNADNNDTYIFMYVDDEDPTTIEPIYLSKSRGDRKAEYLWAIYGYAYDVNDWVALLDSPDRNVGCDSGMILGNNMSARASLFEGQHDYWAEVYNGLRIPTSTTCNDFSNTKWEIYYEGVSSAGRDIISFVKDKGTAYQQYFHVDKATGITYGYENYSTSYRSIYIMKTYKTVVSPEEFEALDENGKLVSYSYGDIEQDVKTLCAKRTAFYNFTLTVPQEPSAFRFIVSAPTNSVTLGGSYENVLYNTAQVYNSGNSITLSWQGAESLVFDRYEIWDFANQQWVVLSESPEFTLNTAENPRKEAAYVKVIYHEVNAPVESGETYTITVENGYFEIDGEKYIGTVEVAANTSVCVYAKNVDGKSFDHWLDGNGEEFSGISDNSFVVTSDVTLSPVYTDTLYYFLCLVDTEGSYVSVNGGEELEMYECFTKVGEKFELSTSADPESEVNTFIGWYFLAIKNGTEEYVFISGRKTITYEIAANKISMEQEGTKLIAVFPVWTTGETMPPEKYVYIRVENGFVNYSTGEVVSKSLDNAYSAISVSNMGMATFFDDPTDEIVYTVWDVAYRYELDGEVAHEPVESFEDEYGYYPAQYWISDPQYSYPDGVISVTAITVSNDNVEDGVEEI